MRMDQQVNGTRTVAEALEHARSLLAEHPAAAAAQAREVISAEPGIAESHILLAHALRATGKVHEAEEAETRAIAIAAQDTVILEASEQIKAGALQQADELLNFYLADTPNDPVAVYLRATIQERLGDRAGACSLLQRAISLAPSYSQARRELDRLKETETSAEAAQPDSKLEENYGLSSEWFTGSSPRSSKDDPGDG
jgi:tetratricopeptide (TPR) repeat protein